jgi:hypothetical protein
MIGCGRDQGSVTGFGYKAKSPVMSKVVNSSAQPGLNRGGARWPLRPGGGGRQRGVKSNIWLLSRSRQYITHRCKRSQKMWSQNLSAGHGRQGLPSHSRTFGFQFPRRGSGGGGLSVPKRIQTAMVCRMDCLSAMPDCWRRSRTTSTRNGGRPVTQVMHSQMTSRSYFDLRGI